MIQYKSLTSSSIYIFIFCFCFGIHFHTNGQSTPKRLGIYEIDLKDYTAKNNAVAAGLGLNTEDFNSLSSLSSQLIYAYSGNPDFVIIDKRNQKVINEELERQKNETFMDGYTINQGKQEGMDYIMMPKYLAATNSVSVIVYEVEGGTVFCKAETDIKGKGARAINYYSSILIQSLNDKCFGIQIPLVRILKSKGDKAREVLVAVGKNQNVRKGYKMEIFETVEETLGDKTLKRNEKVGMAEILLVEDDNFSVVEIMEGGEEVSKRMNAGKQLNCKLIPKN